MAELTQELLELYYDGELSKRKAKWVEKQLEESTEANEMLERMDRMGSFIRQANDDSLLNVSFDGFADRVRAGIEADGQPSFAERLKIWVTEFIEHRRVVWIPSTALAAGAAAVALTLAMLPGDPSSTVPISAGNGGEIWIASADSDVVDAAVGSKIESVNFGEATGMVYELQNDQGGTTGVVWIVEK